MIVVGFAIVLQNDYDANLGIIPELCKYFCEYFCNNFVYDCGLCV